MPEVPKLTKHHRFRTHIRNRCDPVATPPFPCAEPPLRRTAPRKFAAHRPRAGAPRRQMALRRSERRGEAGGLKEVLAGVAAQRQRRVRRPPALQPYVCPRLGAGHPEGGSFGDSCAQNSDDASCFWMEPEARHGVRFGALSGPFLAKLRRTELRAPPPRLLNSGDPQLQPRAKDVGGPAPDREQLRVAGAAARDK